MWPLNFIRKNVLQLSFKLLIVFQLRRSDEINHCFIQQNLTRKKPLYTLAAK